MREAGAAVRELDKNVEKEGFFAVTTKCGEHK